MIWTELEIDVRRQDVHPISTLLFELGCAGIQEDCRPDEAPPPRQPWDHGPRPPLPAVVRLRGWFSDADHAAIEQALTNVQGVVSSPRFNPVPDLDWEECWKRGFEPIHVSDRLTVAAPWNATAGDIVIEPGQGFGTGQHATTRAALLALDRIATAGQSALDVGCGSGILAIAAARLGLRSRGIDVDLAAVEDARRNAARNDVSIPFETTPLPHAGIADVVLANLHAELLVELAEGLISSARVWLVLAGILSDRESIVREKFDGDCDLVDRHIDGEWVCLTYRVRS